MPRVGVPFTKAQVKRAIEAIKESGAHFVIELTSTGAIRLVPVAGPVPVDELRAHEDTEIEL